MTTRAGRPALALLLAACTGCLPAIAHGPRVEPGLSVGATASFATGPDAESDLIDAPFLLGPLGVNVGAGWVPERPGAPAARAGLHVSVPFVQASQGDLYIQAPTGSLGALDGGAGLGVFMIAPTRVLTPYIQLGHVDARGSGWYTTQGLFVIREPHGGYRHGVSHLAWVPALAYRSADANTATHFFVTAALGRKLERCDRYGSYCEPAAGRWVLGAGLTLEYLFRPRPGAPPRH